MILLIFTGTIFDSLNYFLAMKHVNYDELTWIGNTLRGIGRKLWKMQASSDYLKSTQ